MSGGEDNLSDLLASTEVLRITFSLVPIPASIIKHNRNHSSRCLDRTHYYRNAHEVLELTGEWKAGVSLPSPSMQHCQVDDDAKKIF